MHPDDAPKVEVCNHKAYGAAIASELTDIIASYKQRAMEARTKSKRHPEKKAKLDKKRLEELSKKLRAARKPLAAANSLRRVRQYRATKSSTIVE